MGKGTGAIIAAVVIAAFSGCGGRSVSDSVTGDGRLEHGAERNEVKVVTLKRGDFTMQLVSNGRLEAAARSSLSFGSTGPIAEIRCRNGERVKKGDMIAELDRSKLELALRSARLAVEQAELDLYDVLAGQGYTGRDTTVVPESVMRTARMRSGYEAALNGLRQAEYEMEGAVIRAPFDGKVADIDRRVYDQAEAGAFCTLIDDSRLYVDFTVLESEYGFLEEGLSVRVLPFSGNGSLYGSIVSVNPTVDANGQVSVRAEVRNDGSLIDGMHVKVIVEKSVPDCMVVPKSAVVIRDNLEVLFRHSDGKAQWTYVHTLMSNGDSHVVEANRDRGAELNEGDEVIVSGNLNLADGSSVTVVGE